MSDEVEKLKKRIEKFDKEFNLTYRQKECCSNCKNANWNKIPKRIFDCVNCFKGYQTVSDYECKSSHRIVIY